MEFEFIEVNEVVLKAMEELNKIITEKGITDEIEISELFKDILRKQENLHKVNKIGDTAHPEELARNLDEFINKKREENNG